MWIKRKNISIILPENITKIKCKLGVNKVALVMVTNLISHICKIAPEGKLPLILVKPTYIK